MDSQLSYFPANNENEIARNFIFHSFLELVKQKTISQISVTEICKNAGVARSSFYFNFHSKKDMLNKYFDGQLYTMIKHLRKANKNSRIDLYQYFVRYLRLHAFFITLLIENQLEKLLSDRLFIIVWHLLKHNIFISSNNPNYQCSFITGGLTAVIITWAKDGFVETDQQLINIVMNLMQFFKK